MGKLRAVIFDLDGTLLDNNDYHLKAWKRYLEQSGMEISDEEFKDKISGRTNRDAVRHLYKKDLTEAEASHYYLQKEAIYREMYKEDITPVTGLIQLLEDLANRKIAMAVATSGIQVNIDYMFEHVDIQKYFSIVVNSSHITNGKPDPEIFLTTAKQLNVKPENCVVFEDSVAGVQAAIAAGMKVVALTTSHSAGELKMADMIIKDYTAISYDRLASLL